MSLHLFFEKQNEEIINKLIDYNLEDILSIEGLIRNIDETLTIDVKCWIYIDSGDTWILLENNSVLNFLVKSMVVSTSNPIDILFRENRISPNTSVIESLPSQSTGSLKTLYQFTSDSIILNDVEPFSQDPIELTDHSELVAIPSSKYPKSFYFVNADFLLKFIKTELYNGKNFFEISFSFENNKNEVSTENESIIFDNKIWMQYLTRNNNFSSIFLDFFGEIFYNCTNHGKKLEELKNNDNLYLRLQVFIYDLLKFKIDRLSFVSLKYPEYYFTSFHFTDDEIEYLLNFPTSCGLIFKDSFHEFILTKEGETEICTSHSIAPYFYNVFNISRNFIDGIKFKKFYKKFSGF